MLWKHMRPGELRNARGVVTSGLDPSGKMRGDRYLTVTEARAHAACPALALLDAAMDVVGGALAAHLTRRNGEVGLVARSDALFACFPGGGAQYGAHRDGGGTNAVRLTSIVYANPGWAADDGGALQMYNEQTETWHAIMPAADRFVVFYADTVLHRVQPAFRRRYALTCWWL